MDRITPEMVKDAADRLGLKLVTGTAFFGELIAKRQACPVDVLLVDSKYSIPHITRKEVCEKLSLPFGYLCGFLDGVDSRDKSYTEWCRAANLARLPHDEASYDEGYADGEAINDSLHIPHFRMV